jgi:tetratricopeptide (TPR) repeat protein
VILRLFFEEQKREELSALQNEYVHACKKILPFAEGAFEQHTSLAQACFRFVENLRDENFYKLPDMLSFCSSIIDSWSKQKNFSTHLMIKEMLLFSALQEHCKLVKLKPCDAQVHAALGNAYLVIADLYKDPRQKTAFWLPQKMLSSLKQKRIRAIEHAIEEFKIVKEFAPSEPWSVSQLARCYLETQNMQQAAIAYEEVVKLSPYDEVALFSLGKLYFKMGKNADGLKMYEQLKSQNASCADELLSSYGDICDQNYWWSVSK